MLLILILSRSHFQNFIAFAAYNLAVGTVNVNVNVNVNVSVNVNVNVNINVNVNVNVSVNVNVNVNIYNELGFRKEQKRGYISSHSGPRR